MARNKKQKRDFGGMVYSTDPDYDYDDGSEGGAETLVPDKQNLKISLKRMKGNKQATVIWNYKGKDEDLQALGKMLKQKCGTGGAVKDGEIIVQGDKRKQIGKILDDGGYKYKFAGG